MSDPNRVRDLSGDEKFGVIYRTAAQMICEKGFEATSMNEIAEALDLSKSGLYYYVEGKKQLLHSIMSFAMDMLDVNVVRPAEAIADPEEKLHFIIEQHARLLTDNAGALAVLIDADAGLPEEQREEIVRRKRGYFEFLRRSLEELKAMDRLRPLDTTVAAFGLLGMVMSIARWYDPKGHLAIDRIVEDLTEMALRGMLVGEGPSAESNPRRKRRNR